MSERIALAGVIGDPVSHSLSPRLHGHWLRRYGLPGHYVPMRVVSQDLADVLRCLPRMGFRGVNVTIPHKEHVLALADQVTDQAALIGAANTLTFTSSGAVQADNTDVTGFIASLRVGAPAWDPRSSPAVVLGAGGAARAVIAGLVQAGVPRIRVFNRTRARADALQDAFGGRVQAADWTRIGAFIDDAGLVVNTTSLGMAGQPDLTLPLNELNPRAVVTDLVYTPRHTALLQDAKARGCVTVDGIGMLIQQAVPGFERWFGQRPEVDEAVVADLFDA